MSPSLGSKKALPVLCEGAGAIGAGGAVAAAAVLNNKIDVKNKKILVMISGGNIDLSLFNKL